MRKTDTYEKDFGSYNGTAGSDGFFSWKGAKKTKIEATVGGTKYTCGLKFDSNGKIKFTTTNNVITINNVATGAHTLERGSGENTIFYIKFQYN